MVQAIAAATRMVALPGLTLAPPAGPESRAAMLATFARHVERRHAAGTASPIRASSPEYDSVDAALWFFQAVRAYHEATGDDRFLGRESIRVLEDVGAWNERGTRCGIVVDPDDGLLRRGRGRRDAHLDGRAARATGR